jgi:amidohydrolase
MSAASAVDAVAGEAVQLALEIHAAAETALLEHRSSRACAEQLAAAGFSVRFGEGELATAFRAELDSGRPGPRIALLAEYDALRDLGHACGHNLIAGACVAAACALALDGLPAGSLVVFGTPAEETGFGKPAMLAGRWFADVDMALSIHAAATCAVLRSCNALRAATYDFRGVPAHVGEPWHGRNALDAVIQLFNASHALRARAYDGERVHGIVVEGGTAYNVVPDAAVARFGIRAATVERADALAAALDDAAQAAALATGTSVRTSDRVALEPLRWDPAVARALEDAARAVGLRPGPPLALTASTDVGNVSQSLPTALLLIDAWPKGTEFHTTAAAEASASEGALRSMCDGARALAQTVVDLSTV